MAEAAEVPPPPARRRRRLRRALRWTAGTLAVVLVVALVGAYLAYRELDANLEVLQPDLGTDRPEPVTVLGKSQPINLLLVGTDTRVGQSSVKGGSQGGDLADTTILLHLSADRSRAYGVSIPRDLMVRRPDCPAESGEGTVSGSDAVMFNTAYGVGGIGCAVRTVEAMTDIRIDHFAVVTFDGFRAVADALGGVPVCVPEEVYDGRFDVTLPAGRYEAKGDVALSYVTLRLGLGDGSDIGRMKRQQAFLAATAHKVLSVGTLANPVRLYSFLDAATSALAVDEGLGDLRKLADLATQVDGIGVDRVRFLTMPIAPYRPDPNRLAIGPGADELWAALRHDRPLTPAQLEGSTSAAAGAPETRESESDDSSLGPRISLTSATYAADGDRYGLC